jgi:hypothetical protein
MSDLAGEAEAPAQYVPRWIARSFTFAEGRDPLGFQTTTQDRLMPVLLPGLLELTRRARYFSFHAFLLDEYREHHLPTDLKALSDYIKRCEWDLGLAIQRCPRQCGSSPVGARRLGSTARGLGPFVRDESVESALGGYGLYYRSPLASLGIVAGSGTLLGDRPIPIDVLFKTDRAARLAEGFRSSVRHTAYFKRWMWTDEPLPVDVVDEYAEAACLCRLKDRSDERSAVHDALFGDDGAAASESQGDRLVTSSATTAALFQSEVKQRRCSVAHYLTLVQAHPDIISSEAIFREALWQLPVASNAIQARVAGQWGSLIAKDVWQEAVCSVWSEFCRRGLERCRQLGRGLTWDEAKDVVMDMTAGPPQLGKEKLTSAVSLELKGGGFTVRHEGKPLEPSTVSLEALRSFAERENTGMSGLVTLLELSRRASVRSDVGWYEGVRISSFWQPSLANVLSGLSAHLDRSPTVGESLWWIVSNFVLPVHERISYSKLPEFTFRFRWEEGLLKFYDNGIGRFPLGAIRHAPLASLTSDLGLWQPMPLDNRRGVLTEEGKRFVDGVFG